MLSRKLMIERFQSKTNLIEALCRQLIVRGNEPLAIELSSEIKIIQLDAGINVISQGNSDNDLFFILSGRVSVNINEREVAVRVAGEHIGEVSVIDPSIPRLATITTLEKSVLGQISESTFSRIAQRYPKLWRLIALHLGDRLRQRSKLVSQRNPRPVIFIGSSTEALSIAQKIQSGFTEDDFIVKVWTDKVFGASRFPLEDLENQIKASDFGILVFSSDDKIIMREREFEAPRDNVVFELGLFMGALTRDRTFMVAPKGSKIKIPSDLLGITKLEYLNENETELTRTLTSVCSDLREIINSKWTK